MKRAFISITWGSIPEDAWLRIVLIDPRNECIPMYIPDSSSKRKMWVVYKAYWKNRHIQDSEKKIFDMVFPYWSFRTALLTLPPELRQGDPVEFEFKRCRDGKILLRNWKVL